MLQQAMEGNLCAASCQGGPAQGPPLAIFNVGSKDIVAHVGDAHDLHACYCISGHGAEMKE